MIIQLYEGILRNRVQLCRELHVVQGSDRCDTERAILEAGWRTLAHPPLLSAVNRQRKE